MASLRLTFLSPSLQKQFERKGYVVVPLLEKEDVEYLLSILNTLNHDHDKGFFTTTWLDDTPARIETHRILKERLSPRLDQILKDYRFHYGNFFVKKPGNNSQCEVHQDWTMVDESQYSGITIWCPLTDVTQENGCLRVVKGSHRLKNQIRGRNSYNYLQPLSPFIYKYFMQDIPMKSGEAVIFHQRLIHGSGNNQSMEKRVACGLAGVPAEASIIHYAAENGHPEKLRILDAENDFYSRNDTFAPLYEVPAIKRVEIEEKYLDKTQLLTNYITDWFWK